MLKIFFLLQFLAVILNDRFTSSAEELSEMPSTGVLGLMDSDGLWSIESNEHTLVLKISASPSIKRGFVPDLYPIENACAMKVPKGINVNNNGEQSYWNLVELKSNSCEAIYTSVAKDKVTVEKQSDDDIIFRRPVFETQTD